MTELVEREVRFILEDWEKLERASQLVDKMEEVSKLLAEAKVAQSQFKAKIEIATQEVNRLANVIQDGYEMRTVPCEVQKDYRTGAVNTVYPETGEVVETRAMSASERQQDFIDVTPALGAPSEAEGPAAQAAPEEAEEQEHHGEKRTE